MLHGTESERIVCHSASHGRAVGRTAELNDRRIPRSCPVCLLIFVMQPGRGSGKKGGFMRKKLLIAAAVLSVVLTAAVARANVIYDWIPISQAGHAGLLPIGQIVFTDAAVASGSFTFSEFCLTGCPPGLSAGLASATGPLGSNGPVILLDINVAFLTGGTLTGTTDYNDFGGDFFVNGSNNSWSGVMNSDSLNCNDPNPCRSTGYWQAREVFEPASSLALFGMVSAVGFLAYYRRNIWRHRRESPALRG